MWRQWNLESPVENDPAAEIEDDIDLQREREKAARYAFQNLQRPDETRPRVGRVFTHADASEARFQAMQRELLELREIVQHLQARGRGDNQRYVLN
jgi:hypothetical protein